MLSSMGSGRLVFAGAKIHYQPVVAQYAMPLFRSPSKMQRARYARPMQLALRRSNIVSTRGRATDATEDQRGQEQHDENEEQDLGDAGRSASNAEKTKRAGDKGNDEKHDGVVKHGGSPVERLVVVKLGLSNIYARAAE